MKKLMKISLYVLVASFVFADIGQDKNTATESDANVVEEVKDIVLCGHCGEVKDSERCCAQDAEVHSCGAHKGSPACCAVKLSGNDVVLCSACGLQKVENHQCPNDAVRCKDCGRVFNSAGCCLLKQQEKTAPIKG